MYHTEPTYWVVQPFRFTSNSSFFILFIKLHSTLLSFHAASHLTRIILRTVIRRNVASFKRIVTITVNGRVSVSVASKVKCPSADYQTSIRINTVSLRNDDKTAAGNLHINIGGLRKNYPVVSPP